MRLLVLEQQIRQLFFSSHGTGVKHSLKPQKTEVTGFIQKNVGTVVCKESHNLRSGDRISLSVVPGITTSYKVEYDEVTKRTIINPLEFGSSGVDTSEDTITISGHGYKTGDKVLYQSSNPITPLFNNFTYFVIRIDDNTFKLSETYFKSKKVSTKCYIITSTGSGHKISLINPPISLTRGYKTQFDLTYSSLTQVGVSSFPLFDFELYRDVNFTNPYFNNKEDNGFQVIGVGTVGVTITATVDLSLTENTPTESFLQTYIC